MQIDTSAYQRVLGDEIRRLRKQRGWTRKDLNTRLQSEISLQTLATYELGTRHVSVVRFVEICLALDMPPHEVLSRVHERVFTDTAVGRIRVDLRRVVRDRTPELQPLRRWAKGRLDETGARTTDVQLDIAALEQMAELCGLQTVELIGKLRDLGAASTTG